MLSQCGVFMEEPPECLSDSVDLRPEGCPVRGEGFEPCLSFKLDVRDYNLELSDSVSNLSLHFSIVCFRQFLMLPGEVFFNLGFRSSIPDSFARLFANTSLTPVIVFSNPASSLLAWVTHAYYQSSSGWSQFFLGFDGRCRLCRIGPRVRCFRGCSGGIYLPAGALSQRSCSDPSACNQ